MPQTVTAPLLQYAVRHPRRGKSHILREGVDHHGEPVTVCWRPAGEMDERVPVTRPAPEDRCRQCAQATGWDQIAQRRGPEATCALCGTTGEVGPDNHVYWVVDPYAENRRQQYRCAHFQRVERGALARAAAMVAGDPDWMNVTRWPRGASEE